MPVPAVDTPPTEHKLTPSADSEPEPATITEPKSNEDVMPGPTADPVPSGAKSDQVCEPAINSLMELTRGHDRPRDLARKEV